MSLRGPKSHKLKGPNCIRGKKDKVNSQKKTLDLKRTPKGKRTRKNIDYGDSPSENSQRQQNNRKRTKKQSKISPPKMPMLSE